MEKAAKGAPEPITGLTELFVAIKGQGVKMVAAEGGTGLTVDNDNPSRKMILRILGAVSEWEISWIVQKLRAARVRSKERNGRCEGRKPSAMLLIYHANA